MASTDFSSSDLRQPYPAVRYGSRDTAVTARRSEIAEQVKLYFEEWRGPIYAYVYS